MSKKKLTKLFELNKKKLNQKNRNIIEIIANEKLINNIYHKLKLNMIIKLKKKKNIDKINLKIIKTLSKQIKTGVYQWYIAKDKDTKNMFNFKNWIVQKLIKVVLTIIYEPIFQVLKHNNLPKTTKTAVKKLQLQNQNLKFALKGKIDNNVNHKILLKILKKKINDNTFLELIKTGLKNNILLTNSNNLILINIYMHTFDTYIFKKIKKLNFQNKTKNKIYFNQFKNYILQITKTKKKLLTLIRKKNVYTIFNIQQFRKYRNKLKNNKIKYTQISNNKKKNFLVSYNRYHRNWIILTNYNNNKLKKLKKKLTFWLKKKLKIRIISNKNLIIDINKKKITYLGFTLHNVNQKVKKIIYKNKIIARKKLFPFLFLGINHKFVKNKLIRSKIITPQYQPRHVSFYYNLKPVYIITKFKKELKMCIKYYYNTITKPSDLSYYYYVYKFSCLKTLAIKMKKSISYISIKYTDKLKINEKNKLTNETYFPSYSEIINSINKKSTTIN